MTLYNRRRHSLQKSPMWSLKCNVTLHLAVSNVCTDSTLKCGVCKCVICIPNVMIMTFSPDYLCQIVAYLMARLQINYSSCPRTHAVLVKAEKPWFHLTDQISITHANFTFLLSISFSLSHTHTRKAKSNLSTKRTQHGIAWCVFVGILKNNNTDL